MSPRCQRARQQHISCIFVYISGLRTITKACNVLTDEYLGYQSYKLYLHHLCFGWAFKSSGLKVLGWQRPCFYPTPTRDTHTLSHIKHCTHIYCYTSYFRPKHNYNDQLFDNFVCLDRFDLLFSIITFIKEYLHIKQAIFKII